MNQFSLLYLSSFIRKIAQFRQDAIDPKRYRYLRPRLLPLMGLTLEDVDTVIDKVINNENRGQS